MRIFEQRRSECTAEMWHSVALNLQRSHLTPRYYDENNRSLEGSNKYIQLLVETNKQVFPHNIIPYHKLNPDIPITVQVLKYFCDIVSDEHFKNQNNFKTRKSCPFETPAAKVSKKNYLNYVDISPGIFSNNKLRRGFYLLFCSVHPAFEIKLIESIVPNELDTCAAPGIQIVRITKNLYNHAIREAKRLAYLDFPHSRNHPQECDYGFCNQKHQFKQAVHEIISITFPSLDTVHLMDKCCNDSWIDRCLCISPVQHILYRIFSVYKNIVELVAMGFYFEETRQLETPEC